MREHNIQINSIVLLRAIAALGVCFVHLQMVIGFKINAFFDFLFNNGQQGVAVFFVISGFVLPYSLFKKGYQINDFFNFLLKRSIRVDPAYWCSIVLLFLFIPLPLSMLNIKSVLLHLTYLVPFIKSAHWFNDIFWTLSIEFQFYIILGLLYPLLNRFNGSLSILIVILLSVFCIKYTIRGIIISNVYQFAFGYFAFLAYTNSINRRWFWAVLVVFSIYIVFAKSIISGVVPAFTVTFLLLYKSNINVPILNFLGKISYSLYLIHIPVSVAAVRLLTPWVNDSAVLFITCLSLSILIAYTFFILIEQPTLKLSKKIRLTSSFNEGKTY